MTQEQFDKLNEMAEPRSEEAIKKAEERKKAREEKKLLLKYLSMALPYGVCAKLPNHHLVEHVYKIEEINMRSGGSGWTTGVLECAGRKKIYSAKIDDIKPYLRPMSSMTEEEKKEMKTALSPRGTATFEADGIHTPMTHIGELFPYSFLAKVQDWLLEHHFDFMGLIPMDVAIEVTDENDPYKDWTMTQKQKERNKELSLSLGIQAYLNTASDELFAKGKPYHKPEDLKQIHDCMKMWQKLHNRYFYGNDTGYEPGTDYQFAKNSN